MRRHSPAITALLAVVALVLLPAISNVEASALPQSWTPLLWIAWPAGLLLAAPLVYLEIRQRHHRSGAAAEPPASADERERLDRAVTDLAAAVQRQWTDELARRSIDRGTPLRVRWEITSRPVARHLADVVRPNRAGRLPVSGDTAGQLVTLLDGVQDGQVVILGEPGAGKTVLAVRLALQLLSRRRTGDRVPVLLSLSSWNPATEDPRTWLARRILEDHPALGDEGIYGGNAAAALVAGGRVLAVLDGLDEIPEDSRSKAIVALDRAAGAEQPMIVTCRGREYEDAVTQHGEFLRRAAVVEVLPVCLDDARQYLIAAAPADASPWPPVLDELNEPLAQVLTSPLMISLARTVYTAPASSPGELLRFGELEDIERHLLDEFIDVAYRDVPVSPDAVPAARYPPERARKWLEFLARHARDSKHGELAWWHLFGVVPRSGRALVAGVTIGLVFGMADVLAVAVAIGPRSGLANALPLSLVSGAAGGLGYGLVVALIAGLGHPRLPTQVQLRFDGTTRLFLGRFAASCTIGVAMALTAGMRVWPAIGLGLAVGLTFAAQVWLDAFPDASQTPTPRIALLRNRTAALGFGLTLTVAFGFFESMSSVFGDTEPLVAANPAHVLLLSLVAVVAAGCAGYLLYGWVGCAVLGVVDAGLCAYALTGAVSGRLVGVVFIPFPGQHVFSGIDDALFGIALGLTLGIAGVVSRAWGGFCLARIWLALHGHLPWRLMRFLDDAHRRGVLRQSGAVYQFRHARLQDQLADTDPAASTAGV